MKKPAGITEEELDFSVMPHQDYSGLLHLFGTISRHAENLKWPEIKNRCGEISHFHILFDTAVSLSSLEKATTLFRQRNDANDALVAIWMARVLRSAEISAFKNRHVKFSQLTADDLREISMLCVDETSPRFIQEVLLKKHGVVLVYEPSFSGMKLDGATSILVNGIPVVGLSLRYSRYDYFWFTLMHELSHVAIHGGHLSNGIYDDFEETHRSDIEIEADRFATDALIPRRIFDKALVTRTRSQKDLDSLAKSAGIHPVVAAGLVRYHLKNYQVFSDVIASIDVRNMVGG
jgi:HTH-type transcriptional regulator / antitoxin HigA